MERKEPVMDMSAMELQNRVKLTWREVRDWERKAAAGRPAGREEQIARNATPVQETVAPQPALSPAAPPVGFTSSAPVRPASVAPFEEVRTASAAPMQELSDELRAAIATELAPKIEASVRAALRETLDAALANAMARAKGDVERSLSTVIAQAVAKELKSLALADRTKRRT